MSGIFGIFNLDGKPVAPEPLQAMHDRMAYWGPDGSGLWYEGHVGLGHLMLHNTPESLHESLPRQHSSAQYVITASARIDNREEMFGALSIPHPERVNMPDSELILRAYEKWGEDCPDCMLGDWVFALWDPRRHKLFIARDHHGNTGLYCHGNSRFFAFATSLRGLLALPDVPKRLNQFRIAQMLVSWPQPGQPTCYEDIFRLPPAHAMTVSAEGIDLQRYWYLEHTPDLRLGSDDEYTEAFLDVFTEAVHCRLRSHRAIGVSLSGGVDSGAVAAQAARELKKRNQRLLAFSSVPMYDVSGTTGPSRFGDETPFIQATTQFAGNTDVTYGRAQDVSPLKGVERALDIHWEPVHAAANAYWTADLMDAAQKQDIGTLLTGQGGNLTISWPGREAGRERLLSLLKRRGLWGVARGYIVHPLIPDSWIRHYRRYRTGEDPWQKYSAINPALACELDLTNQMALHGHDPTFSRQRDPREHRLANIRPGRYAGGARSFQKGAYYSMELRDPTVDKRVMAFCLAIPNEQYMHKEVKRLLIRRAMDSLLPHEVLWNPRRGRQAADIGHRLLQSGPEVQSALLRLENSPLARQYLDIAKMRQVFEVLHHRIDPSTTGQSASILMRGLMVGSFIRRFEYGEL